MQKTILITGSTDGIGLATAKILASQGHHVLLHGRNAAKLKQAEKSLSGSGHVKSFTTDLSRMTDVISLANTIADNNIKLDVLINNAGVYKAPNLITQDGLDVRFAVNTIAPYLLTQRLLPLFSSSGRVINLSSAAQYPVNLDALVGGVKLSDDFTAYAQSKLAITMWSRSMALSLENKSPVIVAINPGSMLGSKMVKDAFGVAGKDIRIGADILVRAVLSDEFETASGQYFDNDSGRFTSPHPDVHDTQKCEKMVYAMETVLGHIVKS
ncbi:SDR family NAD(P)-dependent oxidoreductase [Candidatus Albibeggiatoa sp. nov. NOAA]|uniref:SDR family NAD(P)-dependent oxidoreductase n=1 Tax=Candidatus Albibeggiatoa sp. nov. NOAA TaxID=3162724 RepID=UPI003303833C|nr:SDR family NAD(P)-dependent oxidoreductase [Thiotrichaceae bacterium]